MVPTQDLVQEAKEQVVQILQKAAQKAMQSGTLQQAELPAIAVEIPADTSHGDFASNLAMASAKTFRMAPAKIAQALLDNMEFEDTDFLRAEMAGPGFLNFFLDKSWFARVLQTVRLLGPAYGRTNYGNGKKVMVEFVSANPTGPMHMGNARGGAIGDCLAAAMEAAGYDVTREFYVNDAGNQIDKFAISLEARYLQLYKGEDAIDFPEDGYQGEDISERAKQFAALHGDQYVEKSSEERRRALVEFALPRNINDLRENLNTYRIVYDLWFHESLLHEDGTVDKVVDILRERGLTYEKEGALWYKATEYGGEKDEVLIRANGNPTYFAADIAYHYNKFSVRKYEKVINVWGADHHGHVARLKGAMDAIGLCGENLDIVLMQLVRLMKDGEPYRMSKRSGKSITLADLLELVPIDAARFFFNMREPGSAMDFDLDLAVEQSAQNPVYYVQYAHARICSILEKLGQDQIAPRCCSDMELTLLQEPEELELIRLLAKFPSEIRGAAVRYDPAGLTRYAIELATLFHKFYNACRVLVDDEALMQSRLCLCTCTRTVIANVLSLLKISAPETM